MVCAFQSSVSLMSNSSLVVPAPDRSVWWGVHGARTVSPGIFGPVPDVRANWRQPQVRREPGERSSLHSGDSPVMAPVRGPLPRIWDSPHLGRCGHPAGGLGGFRISRTVEGATFAPSTNSSPSGADPAVLAQHRVGHLLPDQLALQYRDLMAQDQHLGVLVPIAHGKKTQHHERLRHSQVSQSQTAQPHIMPQCHLAYFDHACDLPVRARRQPEVTVCPGPVRQRASSGKRVSSGTTAVGTRLEVTRWRVAAVPGISQHRRPGTAALAGGAGTARPPGRSARTLLLPAGDCDQLKLSGIVTGQSERLPHSSWPG